MRNAIIALSFAGLTACGKPADPAPAEVAPTAAPAPADAAAAAPDAAATAPDAAPADAAPADTAPADAASTAGEVLVWTAGEKGYETSWLAADGTVIATRAEAVVATATELWALQVRWNAFEEIGCEEVMNELPSSNPKRGAKKWYPSLVSTRLGAAPQDNVLTPAYDGDGLGDKAADGKLPSYWGEHWGKDIDLVGGFDGLVLVSSCDGGYGCGAHGNVDCNFQTFSFGREASVDLEAIGKELEAATKPLRDPWIAEGGEDFQAVPELTAVSLRADGDVDYLYVAEVPYAATDGNWSSYTQAKKYTGRPTAALQMSAVPDVVRTFAMKRAPGVHFGWSPAPTADRAALLAAFKDAALAPPRPADVVPADGDAANAKLAEGRKATKEKRYTDAIAAFDAAIAASDKLARAWSGRGYAKLLAGEHEAAKADFDKALSLDATPKFQAAVYFNLGELALAKKDRAAAKEAFTKANALSPSDAAKKQLERLE